MRLTLKTINDELRRLGHDVHLEKRDGYFYFWKGDANQWLDRTVNVPEVSSLMLEHLIDDYNRLKELNGEMLSGKLPKKPLPKERRGCRRGGARKRRRLARIVNRYSYDFGRMVLRTRHSDGYQTEPFASRHQKRRTLFLWGR